MLHPDRLFPSDPGVRGIARAIHRRIQGLPIVSPHGHCRAESLAGNVPFGDPVTELVSRDHYLLRMLYSQGIALESLGVPPIDGSSEAAGTRAAWRTFAENYALFRATPSKLWFDYTLEKTLGVTTDLEASTADDIYDQIVERLAGPELLPRSLLERSHIEFLATTDDALDDLAAHAELQRLDWAPRVVPTFRPDAVVDPDHPSFAAAVAALGELTGEDTYTWSGYLRALRARRQVFIEAGATASDHGHPTAGTADLSPAEAADLFTRIRDGDPAPADAELFRAQMLVEMAAMSMEDGLVLQLHVGAWRGHNPSLTARFGPDKGADLPRRIDYVGALKPLLDRFGNTTKLSVVVYTLDETTYSRELAPLAGHYPALRIGPPWWFHDSPEGIRRFLSQVIETAGFANTVGFNDDARSLLAIPARHDMFRRSISAYLAGLVAEHRLREEEAHQTAVDLSYGLVRRAFRLDG